MTHGIEETLGAALSTEVSSFPVLDSLSTVDFQTVTDNLLDWLEVTLVWNLPPF